MMQWNDLKRSYRDKVSSLAAKTPEEILGVTTDASDAELRRVHRELVKTYHPDGSDPFLLRHNQEMLKIINAAYDRLRARQ